MEEEQTMMNVFDFVDDDEDEDEEDDDDITMMDIGNYPVTPDQNTEVFVCFGDYKQEW